jgi:serine/threonine protein kinase
MEAEAQPRVLITPQELLGFEIDDRYRLDEIIGGGGMGVVYRTSQRNLSRAIALKLLKLDESEGKHRVQRFKREIEIVSQLSHPNIVRVYDTGVDPTLGLHYIAMELVDGLSLDELMDGSKMSSELAIDIACEITAALTEPHQLDIVHRDIKPANVLVFVRSDDTVGVKVVDFGIARDAASTSSKITTTGVVVGSPMYMAPEVARGEELDGRTDLYSLGVMLYEMLSGSTPFPGATPVAIMLRHAVEEPPSLADAVSEDFAVPELVEVVDRLLAKERTDRFESAKDVLRALESIRAARGMSRVQLDGSLTALQAFGAHMSQAPGVVDSIEVDAFSPTTPMNAAGPMVNTDDFAGWVVSETARHTVMGTTTPAAAPPPNTEVDIVELDFEPQGGSKSVAFVAAALIAVAAMGIALIVLRTPPAEPTAETVAVPEAPRPPAVATPEQPPEPAVAPAAEPDAGMEANDAAEPAIEPAAEPADAAPSKPAKRPRETPREPAQKKDDEVKQGLDWLNKK